jgi:hypothetical protein
VVASSLWSATIAMVSSDLSQGPKRDHFEKFVNRNGASPSQVPHGLLKMVVKMSKIKPLKKLNCFCIFQRITL